MTPSKTLDERLADCYARCAPVIAAASTPDVFEKAMDAQEREVHLIFKSERRRQEGWMGPTTGYVGRIETPEGAPIGIVKKSPWIPTSKG